MRPWFEKNDESMFYKYLRKSNYYFEFGSGGSTFQASNTINIKKVFSVESDKEWHDKLRVILSNKCNVVYLYNEMDTKSNSWGHPGPYSTEEQQREYSSKIFSILDETKQLDLILIDGRFRVSCCLKCFNVINDDCVILFDDFLNRKQYHIVLDYYDIIEKTSDNRMVALKKKKKISVPQLLIERFELIKD